MFGGFSGFLGFDVIAFFGSWVVLVVRVGMGPIIGCGLRGGFVFACGLGFWFWWL